MIRFSISFSVPLSAFRILPLPTYAWIPLSLRCFKNIFVNEFFHIYNPATCSIYSCRVTHVSAYSLLGSGPLVEVGALNLKFPARRAKTPH
jgi:hypothetical protein